MRTFINEFGRNVSPVYFSPTQLLFRFDRYVWAAFEGVAEEAQNVVEFTSGIGGAINCNFALININLDDNQMGMGITAHPIDATMGKHPGAGANTIHRGRHGIANTNITAG